MAEFRFRLDLAPLQRKIARVEQAAVELDAALDDLPKGARDSLSVTIRDPQALSPTVEPGSTPTTP